MSAARTLYHPLRHIWFRAQDPIRKKIAHSSYGRILEIGVTERGLEDVGDISCLRYPSNIVDGHGDFKNNQNNGISVKRGDELLQIHFDGHSISNADELYHTVWETFSDYLSIVSPVDGKLIDVKSDEIVLLEEGLDEETVLLAIETTEEEWEDINRQKCFVTGLEYSKIIENQPRGTFY
mmetsp:Transcript_1701/g.4402  ORF Transcript_1701/g.4402 Transcript_1701/m.4402 type:complete len:180 (+) Transcript_1701:101-640(+)